jgi:hypothetical protein
VEAEADLVCAKYFKKGEEKNMARPEVALQPEAVDVRPVLQRNITNLWSRVEEQRDQLYDKFQKACVAENINPMLIKSGPFQFPASVTFEAWVPRGDARVTERASATVTIDPRPFHKYPFEYNLTWTRQGRTVSRPRSLPLSDRQVTDLLSHLLGKGPKPKLERFRQVNWQIWRPKNKVGGLQRDWLGIALAFCLLVGFLTLAIGIGFVLFGVAIVLGIMIRRRRPVVRNEGKPLGEPRILTRVDSWQTVLFDLGDDQPIIRERFLQALQGALADPARHHVERVWYWGLDGKEEREQFVLTTGRCVVFSQIYRYGKDLYIGWDGHLNRGQWTEERLAVGIDPGTGLPVIVNRLVPATQPNSEYDLMDLNCLMEWTHAQVVKLIKTLIAERKIDQEIDFSIQRAERKNVLGTPESSAGVGTRIRKAFKRVA